MRISLRRWGFILVACLCLTGFCVAQDEPAQPAPKAQNPPRSERDREAGESSSRDTRIDLSPPKDDDKNHPNSAESVDDALGDTSSDVQEFHPWNPHKAMKDIEVGDFYFKRRNYRAALDRYREALFYKRNDAISNFRMAQCLEKLNNPEEARIHYEEYLKILPHGPLAEEARKSLEKLKAEDGQSKDLGPSKN
jgi:tetratricopeptide (TPR) repeat protein